MKRKKLLTGILVLSVFLPAFAMAGINIINVEPTPLFPKVEEGKSLKQVARLSVSNTREATACKVRISVEGQEPYTEEIGVVAKGDSVHDIHVLDIDKPSNITIEVFTSDGATPATSKTVDWLPQRKWKLYDVGFSHQDLGFGGYYQMIRRDVREHGIELALQYCTDTDDWDQESKFRWTIETAEPITGYVQTHTAAEVDELIRRIRQGRIELGAIHNSASTEAMGYEAMARLFYTPNRYIVDLLGIAPRKTALLNDVVGLTRPLPLYSKEAGLDYFFQGRNGSADQLQPASEKPAYYWASPDGDDPQDGTLFITHPYYSRFKIGDYNQTRIGEIVRMHENNPNWIFDCILCPDSLDFSLPKISSAEGAHAWNAKWAWPKVICANMTMFYNDLASQIDPEEVYIFDKDAPNAWADMEITDAKLAGQARKLGYSLPTAETFSTFAMSSAQEAYPWTDIWQAWNRLLMYHEHTDGAWNYAGSPYTPVSLNDKSGGNATYYETEKEMHRALVWEAKDFADAAMQGAFGAIEKKIKVESDSIVAVFNPLAWKRSDVARLERKSLPAIFHLIDNETGGQVPFQETDDGKVVIAVSDVPALGYKTLRVETGHAPTAVSSSLKATDTTIENRFYKIVFDPATGGVAGIFDKRLGVELIDKNAPYKLNEYIYQHYENSYKNLKTERVTDSKITATIGPVAVVMTARVSAFGVDNIEQRVILYEDVDRIDFEVDLVKAPSGRRLTDYNSSNAKNKEAVFYAFPFAIEDFTIKHELAGAVVEPIADQSIGSSTDYYAIQHFTDISNDRYGVTLSTVEAPLIEYGVPRPASWNFAEGPGFESKTTDSRKAEKSHAFLYLMSNMFFTNICVDQPGPHHFNWSIRGHKGDWKKGEAWRLGWETSNRLISRIIEGPRPGSTSAAIHSFASVDKTNVAIVTIKPAEANGTGFIARFAELSGVETTVEVALPFIGEIATANETSLIENDRPESVSVSGKDTIIFTIKPHGIKTIRLHAKTTGSPLVIKKLNAQAVSDMEVRLSWKMKRDAAAKIAHFDVYRGTSADFTPSLRNFVGRSSETSYLDKPRLHLGGWINNHLEPEMDYFYKVRAIDRRNNPSASSKAVKVRTLSTARKNAVPARVEGLYTVHVSPITEYTFISLWFYTNAESDVVRYRIHRSETPNFKPGDANLLVEIDVTASCHGAIERPFSEYNRQLYVDEDVTLNKSYYYKVCAVDAAGQKGPFSKEAVALMERSGLFIAADDVDGYFTESVTVSIGSFSEQDGEIRYTLDGSVPGKTDKLYRRPFKLTDTARIQAALFEPDAKRPKWFTTSTLIHGSIFSAQSFHSPGFGAAMAIDGNNHWNNAWVSKPYGGGTKQASQDIWWAIKFPEAVKIKGVKKVGDDRDIIPLLKNFQIQIPDGDEWKTVHEVKGASSKTITILFDKVVETKGIRIYIPSKDLPRSENAVTDGIVRICELLLITLDDNEVFIREAVKLD